MMRPATIRILLVEDDPDDIELSLRALRKHGIADNTRVARDGADALDLLADADGPGFGLVLLDTRLPRLDGIEVLREIKSKPATRHTPVMMLVSSEQEREFLRRRGVRADGYLVKPVRFDELSGLMHSIGMRCPSCGCGRN
jgi:CheY-like chemotaxis protein